MSGNYFSCKEAQAPKAQVRPHGNDVGSGASNLNLNPACAIW